jgi:hypothetical protein
MGLPRRYTSCIKITIGTGGPDVLNKKGNLDVATTISLSATRTGTGLSSTIVLTSGDTTNAKGWITPPFNPSIESDLAAVKEAAWAEVLRQMQAI